VTYATAGGTATAGSDYEAASGTLTIPAGQTSGTIPVRVYGDRFLEPDETFVVYLTGATNAAITNGQAVGTIVDDEPRLDIDSVSKVEGDEGTTEFVFTVTLSAPSAETVTVDYATANYHAVAGSDYQAAAGTLTFAPWETSQTVTVMVNGDLDEEFDEAFQVILRNPTGAVLGASQGWGTILSEEVPPYLQIYSMAGWEGDSSVTYFGFPVTLSAPLAEIVTVDYYTADNTALAGWDYQATWGTLTFDPGVTSQTIWVAVYGDIYYEEWEKTFFVHLGTASVSVQGGTAVGTIWDGDYYLPGGGW
jgi:hypothetical protein